MDFFMLGGIFHRQKDILHDAGNNMIGFIDAECSVDADFTLENVETPTYEDSDWKIETTLTTFTTDTGYELIDYDNPPVDPPAIPTPPPPAPEEGPLVDFLLEQFENFGISTTDVLLSDYCYKVEKPAKRIVK